MIYLSKNTILMLFCSFRQAERSVHNAQSFPKQWAEFVAYYDIARRTQIAELIGVLKAAGATQDETLDLSVKAQSALFSIVRCAANALCNQFKSHWSFSVQELSFFCRTLERLIGALQKDFPDQENLISIRLACFQCRHLIARRLIGLSIIQKAGSIEHFNQSQYVAHYEIDEFMSSHN
jgi:hypothetical protein